MPDRLIVYTDGGARGNPGPAALGVVLCDAEGRVLDERAEYLGEGTNNEAEYRAVLRGLDLARGRGALEVEVVSDSQLVVRQLRGEYRVRHPRLRPLHDAARRLEPAFRRVRYRHVPRDHPMTRRADALVNAALDRMLR